MVGFYKTLTRCTCLLLVTLFISTKAYSQTPIPAISGSLSISGYPANFFVSGNYAYVINQSPSPLLQVIDISNPGSPILVAGISTLSAATRIYVSGNMAYLTTGIGTLEIVDVSQPTNPVHRGTLTISGITPAGAMSLSVSGNYAYAAFINDNKVAVMDVTSPDSPSNVGSFGTFPFSPNFVQVLGGYAYCIGYKPDGNAGIFIYDVSTPSSPVQVGILAINNYITSCFINGNYAYTISNYLQKLDIVDISVPSTPVHKGSLVIGKGLNSIYVSGQYAYIGTYTTSSGLEIVNVADPLNPVHVTALNDGSEGAVINVTGNYAYLSLATSGLKGLEIISIFNPVPVVANLATSIDQNSFIANWTPSSNATSYNLDVSTDNFATFLPDYNNVTKLGTSSLISGLNPQTNYKYRVKATNSNGSSNVSNSISVLTTPPTPTATAATAISQTGFTANWGAISGASNYYFDLSTASNFSSFVSGYNSLSVATNSLTISGLTAGTTYYYQVRSANTTGSSPSSNSISQITIPPNPTPSAANPIGQTSFTANWASASGASGYLLDVATDAGFTSFVPTYSSLAVLGTSQNITSLAGGTNYYYRVKATNSAGTSGYSSTTAVLTLPAPPVASSAAGITQSSFVANWGSVTGATSYSVDVAVDNTFTTILYNNINVGSLTTYTASSLSPSTSYYYRVRATDATGTSSNSNVISATTTSSGGNVQASALLFSNINSNSITVDFTAGSGSARLVVVNAGSTLAATPVNGITYTANTSFGNGSGLGTGYVVANGTSSTVTVTNLLPGTNYYLQVFEYSGTAGSQVYNTTTAGNNPLNQYTLSTTPSFQASGITFGNLANFSFTLNFSNGNGSSRLVLAKQGSAVNSVPANGTTYTPNSSFGNGTQIGAGNYVVGIGSGPISITGLSPSTTYYFEVFEFNGSGGSQNYNTSGSGNTASQTTLSTPPTLQSSSLASSLVTSNSATINFNSGNGAAHLVVASAGSAISSNPAGGTSYVANSIFGSGSPVGNGYVVGNATGTTITGLSPATTYYFQVFDYNGSGGTENYLATTGTNNPLTLTTLTSAPTANSASNVSQTGFTASWSSVTGATGYQLDISTDNFSTFVSGYNSLTVPGTSQTFSNGNGGTNYQYRVRAINSAGASNNSNTVNVLTIPLAPVASNANPVGQSSFTATWAASTGAASYTIDVASDAGFNSILSNYNNLQVNGTSTTISIGIAAATNYYYRVRAVNASGTSGNSNAITVLTTPSVPTLVSSTSPTQTGFTANWGAVTGATNYFIDIATDQAFSSLVAGHNNQTVSSSPFTATDLASGTTYYFRVRAANSSGSSSSSNAVTQTTIAANPVSSNASAINQTSFTATWAASTGASGYLLDVASDNNFNTLLTNYSNVSVATNSQLVSSLDAGTSYYYRVRAINSVGTSGNSSTITVLTLPASPTASSGTSITQTSFVAQWVAVLSATGYFVDVAADNAFTIVTYPNISAGNNLTYTVPNLSSGSTYYFRVRAANNSGNSPSSNIVSVTTLAGNGSSAPTAPVPSDATNITQTGFTANWASVAGASDYRLDVSTDNFITYVSGYNNLTVTGTTQVVTGLSGGVSYQYRVRANNVVGASPSSSTVSALTIPTNPVNVTTNSIGQTGFTASWSSTGGASTYLLDVSTSPTFSSFLPGYNGASVASPATSKAITGLTNATTYYVRVRASNTTGASGNSTVANALTIPATPTANNPSSVGQTGFTANWSTVSSVSNYFIDVATDQNFTSLLSSYNNLSVASTATSLALSGLNAGTSYYYRLRSANASGSSASSNTISALTIPAAPTASNPSAITQTSFAATWAASTGAASYTIDVATDIGFNSILSNYNNLQVNGTSVSISSGITAATNYYYRVRSVNVTGTSGNSATISALTVPPTPTALNASSPTQTGFTLSWSTVAGATNYFIDIATDQGFAALLPAHSNQTVSSNAFTATDLTSGTAYYYRVRSANISGSSPSSNIISQITVPSNPVSSPASSIGQTSFTATWSATMGADSYSLDVATDSGFGTASLVKTVSNITGTSQVVSALTPGQTYFYQVRATNSAGTSGNSSAVTVVMVPPAVQAIAATNPSASGFIANWNKALGATSYYIDFASDTLFTNPLSNLTNQSVNSNSFTLSNQTSGTTYYYRVRASNASGTSPNSNTVSQILKPGPPNALPSSQSTLVSFTANWQEVTGENGFILDVSTDNFKTHVSGYPVTTAKAVLSYTVSSLLPATQYQYVVQAKNRAGLSGVSNVQPATTNTPTPIQFTPGATTETLKPGFGSNSESVTISGGLAPYTVTLYYRPISGTSYTALATTDKGSGTFQATVSEAWLDELGLEFYYAVTDQLSKTSVNSAHSFIYKTYDAATAPPAPLDTVNLSKYQMFSVPYAITKNSISDVFIKLGQYDKSKWRLFHYDPAKNAVVENGDGLTTIDLGLGYWFISSKAATITPGAGTVTKDASFSLSLGKGWNQLGDPYPFTVGWDAIKAANPVSLGLGSLWTYSSSSGFTKSTGLKPWAGAFVWSDTGGPFSIPISAKCTGCGRIASQALPSDLDGDRWQIPLSISLNGLKQELSVGMAPDAKYSKDVYDEISVPRFMDYLEMATYHKEFFAPRFSTDIVPTEETASWLFTVSSNQSGKQAVLTWDANSLSNAFAKVALLDLENSVLVDMKSTDKYAFEWAEGTQFKIIYAKTGEILPGLNLLGSPYPNPFHSAITIPVVLEHDQLTLQIVIFDALGRKVRVLSKANVSAGVHDYQWDGQNDNGSPLDNGLYLFQLVGDEGILDKPKKILKQ